jgi:hypothetical protein
VSVYRLAKTSGNSALVINRTIGEITKMSIRLTKTHTFPFDSAELDELRIFLIISTMPNNELKINKKKLNFLESRLN